MPKTVDNLGPGASEQYARGEKFYDSSFRKEGGQIPPQTEISVLTPTASHIELLISEKSSIQPQAFFQPPPSYYGQRRNIFSYQLTPSIGPTTKWESNSQKMLDLVNSLPEDSSEKNTLASFVQKVEEINRSIAAIKAELNRYKKG